MLAPFIRQPFAEILLLKRLAFAPPHGSLPRSFKVTIPLSRHALNAPLVTPVMKGFVA